MSPSLVYFFFAFLTPGVLSVDSLRDKWSNSWAVEIRGGRDKADQIAAKYDFINLGPVSCHISLNPNNYTYGHYSHSA